MTVTNRIFLLCAILMFAGCSIAMAQSFAGYHTSHYAGIYGVLSNPASAAGTRYRWDVNIIGADGKAGNTYVKYPKSLLFNIPDTFRKNQDFFLDTSAKRKQNGWEMAEILMPSVMYSIDERQTVSFIWRIRSSANGGPLSTEQANFFGNSFPNAAYTGRNYTIEHAAVSAHAWNEFGFSYARVIKETYSGVWKAGITLKYLGGIAAGYAAVDNATFGLNTRRDATIYSGTLKYGYNEQADHWQSPAISNLKLFENPGIGADIGVIYEYRPDNDGFGKYSGDHWNPGADEYKLRLGLAITDIGGIGYTKSKTNTDLNLTKDHINPNALTYRKNESLQQYARRLNSYFTPIDSNDHFFMALPTTLQLSGDYNIDGRFFVSANAAIALNGGQHSLAKTYALTLFQITPRYDTDIFGAYLPFVINRNGQADLGAGIRIGPLLIGSTSIFTNLLRHKVDHADAFVALRVIPIHFKRGGGSGGGIFHMRKKQLGCPVNN
ncbi:DUF5723 family protein [Chitinophaga vietnamensis]|uniref:DUF5723 family protein n=1 Tax=Chitinophaga vietnamensis TaxID=2593957 RepID=UPI001177B35D|nr:DUF5723 family protein [Chitinophaga vietnamensis]